MPHAPRRSQRWIGLATVIGALLVGTATASADHPGAGDGRIPGKPDFERKHGEIHRYDPATRSYLVKRPGGPARSVHLDLPAARLASDPNAPGAAMALPTTGNMPACATSGHRIVLVYSPRPGMADLNAPQAIRSIAMRMNRKVITEAHRSSSNAVGRQMLVDCNTSGQINVHVVPVPMGEFYDDYAQIEFVVEATLGEPVGADAVKYLVFRDLAGAESPGGGIGGVWLADSHKGFSDNPAQDNNDPTINYNRTRTTTAIVWPEYWATHVTLHELFHGMGSVLSGPFGSPAPPFYNGFGHCTDGVDVMCYPEPDASYTETRCPRNGYYDTPAGVPIDCGYDTYFDTLEEAGEWLNTYWNTGGAENPYLVSNAPTWRLRNSNSAGAADVTFAYGSSADTPLAGDWNADGVDTPGGVLNGNLWHHRNANSTGPAAVAFLYGNPTGMLPVVGDWNKDGTDTPGMFQAGTWYLRNSNTGGVSDISFAYGTGTSSPKPVTGDWNNDGTDTPGIRVGNTWYLRNSNTGGVSEISFAYGNPSGHIPLTGDWDGNGTDTPGIYDVATNTFHLRNSNSAGAANVAFVFGSAGDLPVVGDWNGDGVDTVGVVHEDL